MTVNQQLMFKWNNTSYYKVNGFYFKKKKFRQEEQISEETFLRINKRFLNYKEKVDEFNEKQIKKFIKLDYKNGKINVLDLFCGVGGLSLGFKNAGFNVLLGIDNDFSACKTYAANFKKTAVLCLDLTEKEGYPSNIKNLGHETDLYFDLIIGGPPCQGFSRVGRPKIRSLIREQIWDDPELKLKDLEYNEKTHWFYNDPRNVLYKKFLNYVSYFHPSAFLIENVPGMKSFNNGMIINQIKLDFEDQLYSIQDKILNAVDFNVPQKRKRLFLFGVKCETKKIAKKRNSLIEKKELINNFDDKDVPLKFNFPDKDSKFKPLKEYKSNVTVKDAIEDLINIKTVEYGEILDYKVTKNNPYIKLLRYKIDDDRLYNFVPRETTKRDKKIYKFIDQGEIYRDLPEKIKNFYKNDEKYKKNSVKLKLIINETIKECMPYGDGTKFGDKLKRLIWNKPSWTVMAHIHKDGYRYIHPKLDRTLSVREAARLQSFPDSFIFKTSRSNQFKHVGNAVPPFLSETLAYHIKEYMTEI
ncbi:MAG: DNA cytosine methyltransferase [Candidatus Hodarchaeota archaeon]